MNRLDYRDLDYNWKFEALACMMLFCVVCCFHDTVFQGNVPCFQLS